MYFDEEENENLARAEGQSNDALFVAKEGKYLDGGSLTKIFYLEAGISVLIPSQALPEPKCWFGFPDCSKPILRPDPRDWAFQFQEEGTRSLWS